MSNKRRVIMSGRVDLRSLATCVAWLSANGIRPANKSDALHVITEALTELILKNGQGRLYRSVEEAIGALEVQGLNFTPDKRTRQGRDVFKALTLPEVGTPEATAKAANLESEFEEALSQFLGNKRAK